MIDKYAIYASNEELGQSLAIKGKIDDYVATYNANPTQSLPVAIYTTAPTILHMFWGANQVQAKNKSLSSKLVHTPLDSAFTRPVFKKLLETNRCFIPVNGFYAWKQIHKKKRSPYYFHFKEGLFGIAGIWEDSEDLEGNAYKTFRMISATTSGQHADYDEYFPAYLTTSSASDRLNPVTPLEDLKVLIQDAQLLSLEVHAVSPLIDNVAINEPELIKPTTPSDQYGNYTLFG